MSPIELLWTAKKQTHHATSPWEFYKTLPHPLIVKYLQSVSNLPPLLQLHWGGALSLISTKTPYSGPRKLLQMWQMFPIFHTFFLKWCRQRIWIWTKTPNSKPRKFSQMWRMFPEDFKTFFISVEWCGRRSALSLMWISCGQLQYRQQVCRHCHPAR